MTENKNVPVQTEEKKNKKKKRVFATKKEKVIYEIKSWTIIILVVWVIRTMIFCNYIIPTGSMENTMMTGTFVIGNQFYYGAQTPHKVAIPFTQIGFMLPHTKLPAIRKPQSGDIVIFEYPQDRMYDYVKRCIGTPGTTVEIRDKRVYVDDVLFEEAPKANINYNYIQSSNQSHPYIWPSGNGNPDQYRPVYIPKKGDILNLDTAVPEYAYNIMILDGNKVRYQFGNWFVNGERKREYLVKQDYYFMMGDYRDNSADSRFWGLVPYSYIKGKPTSVQFLLWDKTWKKVLVITGMGLILFYAFFWDSVSKKIKKTKKQSTSKQ